MTHEQAWPRLPDLLIDRDDSALLAHVRSCHACQQQTFRLNRVDRILRAAAPQQRRLRIPWQVSGAIIAAAATVVIVVISPVWGTQSPVRVLHSASGATVGQTKLTRSNSQNLDLSLELHEIKMTGHDVYVLWTRAAGSPQSVPVGRFMVDASGSCKARFTLPARTSWTKFWVTPPSQPSLVLATT